jgi:tetratricopeptide (TPR) repeat protein
VGAAVCCNLTVTGQDPGGTFEQARFLIERKRLGEARTRLSTALAHDPDQPNLLYLFAFVEHLEGSHDKAMATIGRVLERSPAHFGARTLMYAVLKEANELPRAELVLIELIRDHSNSAELFARYALLMFQTLHFDKASRLAGEAMRLDPACETALIAATVDTLIRGDRSASGASLGQLLAQHPESQPALLVMVRVLLYSGRYRTALRVASQMLGGDPTNATLLGLVLQLETLSHWSMIAAWPVNRWGRAAGVSVYVAAFLVTTTVQVRHPHVALGVLLAMAGWILYITFWPKMLLHWLRTRAAR